VEIGLFPMEDPLTVVVVAEAMVDMAVEDKEDGGNSFDSFF